MFFIIVALADTARMLHEVPGEHELRRVFWQRLRALAPRHEQVRVLLRAVSAQPRLNNWHAMAHHGTSSVLWREVGWGAGGVRAALDSAQLAAGGVLRRGVVSLTLLDAGNRTRPALAVELWTRGLAALAGGGGEAGGGEEEEAGGGLALEVLGARLPAITLFSSQAELLGLVWSGAGSTPTPVLRAALPLTARAVTLPLLGGVTARLQAAAAAALALDAHAAVSLWSRTATAKLDTRAAAAAEARASVSAPWGALAVRASAHAPASLRIAADLDFYDKVSLCVRAHVDDHSYSRHATLHSALGDREWRVTRRRGSVTPRAGNTLALGRESDRACRALAPSDQH
ncbi:hypothetical protein O0L34_g146 [Tuta absoluta]|nr:hypothetical protein O0L34_g146 [Tuta absoluta]